MSTYFLTGGTGNLGSAILERLLAETDSDIFLLVRADSEASAEHRKTQLLQSLMGARGLDCSSRVTAMRGDVKQSLFGMPRDQYQRLLDVSSRVIHSAGLVRMNLPIAEARASAVGAAENIIHLARELLQSGRLEKVEFVSTVGIGGRLKEVREEWIDTPREFHNTYEQAKAEAEVRVRAAVEEGLPITVHRPSMVVGDSESGRTNSFQVFYHLCEFLAGSRSGGLFPSWGETRLDTIPADYVAKAIIWSAGQARTVGKVLHLCSGPGHSIAIGELQRQVVASFRAAGIAVPEPKNIPRGLFRALLFPMGLFAPARTRRAIKTLPIFLDYLASEQIFHNETTRGLLGRDRICVPPTSAYLDKVLDYYLSHRARKQ